MDSIVKFCPDCSSIFTYDKNIESKLILRCKRCGYIDSDNVKMHFVKSTNYQANIHEYAIPIENTKYDTTLLRTSQVECPNTECIINVKQVSDQLFPEVLLSNKASEDRIMTMTCVHCGVSWS
jgi:DNA-directed RNA polymerase subunit M/transcription elongation factor TFIIS